MYINLKQCARERLLEITSGDIGGSLLTPEDIMRILSAHSLIFSYEYALRRRGRTLPLHASLINGKHTDVLVNRAALLQNSLLTEIFARQLVKRLPLCQRIADLSTRARREEKPIIWVVGPGYGSAFLVAAIAHELNARQAMTRKVEGKDQEWSTAPLPSGAQVQLVDDVIYTADSLEATRSAVLEPLSVPTQVTIQPEVGVVINLSGLSRVHDLKIISLLDLSPRTWFKSECPLCHEGSPAVTVEHDWQKLADSCWLETHL